MHEFKFEHKLFISEKRELMNFTYMYLCTKYITSWLMEPGGSMPNSQGLSNNPYPEPNQPYYPH